MSVSETWQSSGVQELCHAFEKSKICEGPERITEFPLVKLPTTLLASTISFLSLRDKARVATAYKAAYAAYQTVHAFTGYNDRALSAHLCKLNYPVHNPSFVKYFAKFGSQMQLLELETHVPRDKLVLLRNYMPKIQEAHLLGTSDANTLKGLVHTWPHLTRLSLIRFIFSPPSLAHIASCSQLRTLGLPKAIGDSDLEIMTPVLHQLEELSVYGFAITVKGLSILATECPNLRTLKMYNDDFSTATPMLSTIIPRMQTEKRHPNRVIYDIFMQSYFKKGKLMEAKRLLDKMKRDRLPDVGIYSTMLIARYAQAGKLMEAESVLIKMQREGFEPNVLAYNALIDSNFNANDFKRAKTFFIKSEYFYGLVEPVLNGSSRELDLDGMSHNVACTAILLFSESSAFEVVITYGKGHHARYEHFGMKEKVLEFIEKERLPLKVESIGNRGRMSLLHLKKLL